MSEPEVPLGVRVAFGVGSVVVSLALGEAVVRVADGNAVPTLGIFATVDGRIVLSPNTTQHLRRADGGLYTVTTDARGLRLGGKPGRGLVVGDSQVLGMGVDGDETFAARAGLRNAGVPSYGVADARAQADALVPELHPDVVVFVLNQANDWDEGTKLLPERSEVRGGWLLTAANAHGAGAAFWASPLSRVHLLYLGWMAVAPNPPGSIGAGLRPAGELDATTRALVGEVAGFAGAHPDVRTIAAFLPLDAATSEVRAAVSPIPFEGRPWEDTGLRDAVEAACRDAAIPFVDLLPALRDPDDFLARDYHLSATGHGHVATALAAALRAGAAPTGLPGDSSAVAPIP